ncbi:MAG: hypothetical protein HY717_16710 [Planctomycetes bacterium]|nr:hypothetical protein [Planctomycetota bacterium]
MIVIALLLLVSIQDPLTAAQMEEDLRQLADVVSRAWAYADDKKENFGVDLEKVTTGLVRRLPSVKNRREFGTFLEEFVASMQDGHAFVITPGVSVFEGRMWPFELVDAKEGMVIRVKGSERKGVGTGDLLLAVDGEEVEDLVARWSRRVPASTPPARRLKAMRRMRFTSAASIRLLVERRDGSRQESVVDTTEAAWDEGPKSIAVRRLDEKTSMMKIPSFTASDWQAWMKADTQEERAKLLNDTEEAIRKAFTEVADSQVMVLDLRGNGGGTDALGIIVARYLLAPDFTYFSLQTRYSPELLKLPEYAKMTGLPKEGWDPQANPWKPPAEAGIQAYRGRLLVLMDEGCFSTTDNFLACIASLHPNVRFIGRPSEGGTGAPRELVTLKNSNARVTFCVMKVFSPKGRLIEGRGTKPHVQVKWTREDVLKGRDPDLEQALNEARR